MDEYGILAVFGAFEHAVWGLLVREVDLDVNAVDVGVGSGVVLGIKTFSASGVNCLMSLIAWIRSSKAAFSFAMLA